MMTMFHRIRWLLIDRKAVLILQTIRLFKSSCLTALAKHLLDTGHSMLVTPGLGLAFAIHELYKKGGRGWACEISKKQRGDVTNVDYHKCHDCHVLPDHTIT